MHYAPPIAQIDFAQRHPPIGRIISVDAREPELPPLEKDQRRGDSLSPGTRRAARYELQAKRALYARCASG